MKLSIQLIDKIYLT